MSLLILVIWYVIPFGALIDIKAAILLAPRRPQNRHYRYMEAWHLLMPDAPAGAPCGSEQVGASEF